MRITSDSTAVLLLASTTEAQQSDVQRSRWEVEARGSFLVYGPAQHQTGGPMPGVSARRAWRLGERWEAGLGAQLGVFGLGDESRWIGILGGLQGSLAVRPVRQLALSLEVDADAGRIPVCNAWGLCLRFVGAFPAARLGLTWYSNGAIALGASAAVRVVETLGWTGAAGELGAVGRLTF